jgi:hypothetical protein
MWIGYAKDALPLLRSLTADVQTAMQAGGGISHLNDQEMVSDLYIAGKFGISVGGAHKTCSCDLIPVAFYRSRFLTVMSQFNVRSLTHTHTHTYAHTHTHGIHLHTNTHPFNKHTHTRSLQLDFHTRLFQSLHATGAAPLAR